MYVTEAEKRKPKGPPPRSPRAAVQYREEAEADYYNSGQADYGQTGEGRIKKVKQQKTLGLSKPVLTTGFACAGMLMCAERVTSYVPPGVNQR